MNHHTSNTDYDIFNGDADGICALLQLRLAEPRNTRLITGIKRNIQLLKNVTANNGDHLTILDISLDKNRDALNTCLTAGAQVFYVDHHYPGEIPSHKNLHTLIDTDSNICTSLLVNQHLNHQHFLWAITGAYGDNLFDSATALANQHDIKADQAEQLKELGQLINYNGYGSCIDDLHFAPDKLFQLLYQYSNPLEFIQDSGSIFSQLKEGYQADHQNTTALTPEYQTQKVAVFILPDTIWARRISGVFSNELVNQYPDRAHAIVTHNRQGAYLVSVRAPLNNKTGDDELCRQFETGGGRKAAAGINHLPSEQLQHFIDTFSNFYSISN